jgi:hypothetical protein
VHAAAQHCNRAPLLLLPLLQVRSMMNCSTLTGAPLEDEGGNGTAGNHWEYRLFQVGGAAGAAGTAAAGACAGAAGALALLGPGLALGSA